MRIYLALSLLVAVAPVVAAEHMAKTLRVYDAADADQGVAVDDHFFYAVDNVVIAKHRRDTGELVARWDGGDAGSLQHINSCLVVAERLECAHSNYPAIPMASSIEWFDAATLVPVDSVSLGMTDEGSVTWTDALSSGRIAGFAHYDEKGGEPYKGAAYGSVVLFDNDWRRVGGYAFPPSVAERLAPHAASGGAIGPDGLLYVLGHDRPEMYVLAKPDMGPYLVHVASLSLEANGQAFAFDPSGLRIVWVIDRHAGKVRAIQLPDVETDKNLRRFR